MTIVNLEGRVPEKKNELANRHILHLSDAAVFTTEEIFRSVYTVTWQNKRLSGKAVKNIDSPSLMSCSQLCLKHSWCTSTNFKESFWKGSESNCELNKHDFNAINDDTKLTDQPGTAFTTFLKVGSYEKRYNSCNTLF